MRIRHFPSGFCALQILSDDPRDDAHGHAPLHIQAGDGKGHIILLSGHPVVVAGVGYRIDAIGEAHIDNALVDICDTVSYTHLAGNSRERIPKMNRLFSFISVVSYLKNSWGRVAVQQPQARNGRNGIARGCPVL